MYEYAMPQALSAMEFDFKAGTQPRSSMWAYADFDAAMEEALAQMVRMPQRTNEALLDKDGYRDMFSRLELSPATVRLAEFIVSTFGYDKEDMRNYLAAAMVAYAMRTFDKYSTRSSDIEEDVNPDDTAFIDFRTNRYGTNITEYAMLCILNALLRDFDFIAVMMCGCVKDETENCGFGRYFSQVAITESDRMRLPSGQYHCYVTGEGNYSRRNSLCPVLTDEFSTLAVLRSFSYDRRVHLTLNDDDSTVCGAVFGKFVVLGYVPNDREYLLELAQVVHSFAEDNSLQLSKIGMRSKEIDAQAVAMALAVDKQAKLAALERDIKSKELRMRDAKGMYLAYVREVAELQTQYTLAERTEDDTAEVLRRAVEEISALPFVTRVTLGDTLDIYTNEAWVRNTEVDQHTYLGLDYPAGTYDFRLGAFKIRIPVKSGSNTPDIRMYAITPGFPPKGYWDTMSQAPHISASGNPCWGNAAESVAEMCLRKEYAIVAQMCWAYLTSVNTNDVAGEAIWMWERYDPATGKLMRPNCPDSNVARRIVEDAELSCSLGADDYDVQHDGDTEVCCVCGADRYVDDDEEDEGFECPRCGHWVCYDCSTELENGESRYDGQRLCQTCADELGDGVSFSGENYEREEFENSTSVERSACPQCGKHVPHHMIVGDKCIYCVEQEELAEAERQAEEDIAQRKMRETLRATSLGIPPVFIEGGTYTIVAADELRRRQVADRGLPASECIIKLGMPDSMIDDIAGKTFTVESGSLMSGNTVGRLDIGSAVDVGTGVVNAHSWCVCCGMIGNYAVTQAEEDMEVF